MDKTVGSIVLLTFCQIQICIKRERLCIFMQKRALFLHKQVKSTPIFPLHIHKSRTIYVAKSAFRDMNLPQCSQARWPSDFCWIAIRLTPKWPSVSRPITIHHSSDGHRTGGKHTFSIFPTWQTLVFDVLSSHRFIVFQEPQILVSPIIQILTTQKRNKNREFPSKVFLA